MNLGALHFAQRTIGIHVGWAKRSAAQQTQAEVTKTPLMIDQRKTPDPFTIPITSREQGKLAGIRERFISLAMKFGDTNQMPIDWLAVYPETSSLDELYEQLSDLKKCLDSFRPFNVAQLSNLQEAFDTEYTYESNRIEGNALTLMETDLVIHKGMTIEGKPLKDHFEAVNHLNAIEYIREVVGSRLAFDKKILLDIHALILQGIDRANAGAYRRVNVRISGSRHVCPAYEKVPDKMDEYFAWCEAHKDVVHPVRLAAEMHEKLVSIHPFVDGNGRTARLVMNLILLQNGYPITVIASDRKKRADYYDSLEAAHRSPGNDNSRFKLLVAEYVKLWVFKYLEFLAPNMELEDNNKGYYFFKRIEPYLDA